jgi:hypothetical protein
VRIIDVGEAIQTRLVDIPVGPIVVTLTDSLENLIEDEKYKLSEKHLVRAKLTDTNYQLNAFDRLSSRFENLLEMSYALVNAGSEFEGSTSELTRLSPDQIVDQYIDAVHGEVVTPELEKFIKQSVLNTTTGGKQ